MAGMGRKPVAEGRRVGDGRKGEVGVEPWAKSDEGKPTAWVEAEEDEEGIGGV